jgi:ferric-dicitrate binding protein FerR (iron transport regulator)
MTAKIIRLFTAIALCIWAGLASPLPAQQSPAQNPALGLVGKSAGASIGNVAAAEGSSIFSGDYLSTQNNGSLLVRIGALALELEGSSAAHVYRTPYGAIVELNRGSVTYTTPGTLQNLVIVASDVRVTPALSSSELGRVTIDDPCNVTVYSQRGQVNVEAGPEKRIVRQGKAYRVRAENEISYRQYLSPDADDYHNYHEHRPCAPVEMARGRGPAVAGKSRFLIVTAAAVGAGTSIGVWKALESPDRP